MLFLTSIISAVVLTAAGTVYMFFQTFILMGVNNMPQAITWMEESTEDYAVITPEEVEIILANHGAEIEYELNTKGIVAQLSAESSNTGNNNYMEGDIDWDSFVFAESQYNEIAEKRELNPVSLEENEVFISTPFLQKAFFRKGNKIQFTHR